MSGEIKNVLYAKNSCEAPIKHWEDYSPDELVHYFLWNRNKTDCSFVVNDPENVKPNKILKSYKWILKDMSPVLTEILNDKENETRNWNLIPISDPNFQFVITFGHTKKLNEVCEFNLFDFYEIAMKYQIEALKEYVYRPLSGRRTFGSINWIHFFRVLHMEKDQNWSKILRELFYNVYNCRYNELFKNSEVELQLKSESNIKMILDFDLETFNEFFTLITRRHRVNSLLSFKVTEAYLIEHFFNGKQPNPAEEQDNIDQIIVANIIKKIPFNDITREQFENGPGKSNLFDENTKSCILYRLKS